MHRAVGRCRVCFSSVNAPAMLVAVRTVKASQQPMGTAGRDIDLMQTPSLGAKRTAAIATEVLEMQHDPPRMFKVAGKAVFSLRRATAHSHDRVLNFRGKVTDMVRVPAIFGRQATAREHRC
jgi:hypothetical protein